MLWEVAQMEFERDGTDRAPDGAAPAGESGRLGAVPSRPRDEPETAPGRGLGRPLDENVDAAILEATWQLLLRDGYSGMSIASVADHARVGRPAIYRRYRDKSELVAAVIASKSASAPEIDTGNAREDLIAYLEFARRRFTIALAGTLLVEQREHPELMEQFRAGMLRPRRDQIAAALERGKARGEVRADLDSAQAVDALMGSFMYHSLANGRPRKGWSERVVDALWEGFAARGAG
jgi:AcrR family transcriptional regulator